MSLQIALYWFYDYNRFARHKINFVLFTKTIVGGMLVAVILSALFVVIFIVYCSNISEIFPLIFLVMVATAVSVRYGAFKVCTTQLYINPENGSRRIRSS